MVNTQTIKKFRCLLKQSLILNQQELNCMNSEITFLENTLKNLKSTIKCLKQQRNANIKDYISNQIERSAASRSRLHNSRRNSEALQPAQQREPSVQTAIVKNDSIGGLGGLGSQHGGQGGHRGGYLKLKKDKVNRRLGKVKSTNDVNSQLRGSSEGYSNASKSKLYNFLQIAKKSQSRIPGTAKTLENEIAKIQSKNSIMSYQLRLRSSQNSRGNGLNLHGDDFGLKNGRATQTFRKNSLGSNDLFYKTRPGVHDNSVEIQVPTTQKRLNSTQNPKSKKNKNRHISIRNQQEEAEMSSTLVNQIALEVENQTPSQNQQQPLDIKKLANKIRWSSKRRINQSNVKNLKISVRGDVKTPEKGGGLISKKRVLLSSNSRLLAKKHSVELGGTLHKPLNRVASKIKASAKRHKHPTEGSSRRQNETLFITKNPNEIILYNKGKVKGRSAKNDLLSKKSSFFSPQRAHFQHNQQQMVPKTQYRSIKDSAINDKPFSSNRVVQARKSNKKAIMQQPSTHQHPEKTERFKTKLKTKTKAQRPKKKKTLRSSRFSPNNDFKRVARRTGSIGDPPVKLIAPSISPSTKGHHRHLASLDNEIKEENYLDIDLSLHQIHQKESQKNELTQILENDKTLNESLRPDNADSPRFRVIQNHRIPSINENILEVDFTHRRRKKPKKLREREAMQRKTIQKTKSLREKFSPSTRRNQTKFSIRRQESLVESDVDDDDEEESHMMKENLATANFSEEFHAFNTKRRSNLKDNFSSNYESGNEITNQTFSKDSLLKANSFESKFEERKSKLEEMTSELLKIENEISQIQ